MAHHMEDKPVAKIQHLPLDANSQPNSHLGQPEKKRLYRPLDFSLFSPNKKKFLTIYSIIAPTVRRYGIKWLKP
jgi:hypothetical protein